MLRLSPGSPQLFQSKMAIAVSTILDLKTVRPWERDCVYDTSLFSFKVTAAQEILVWTNLEIIALLTRLFQMKTVSLIRKMPAPV